MPDPGVSDPASTIAELVERMATQVEGRVVAVTIAPEDAPPVFIATLDDETGQVDAVFLGRRSIPGIEPGHTVSLDGRVVMRGEGLAFFNPRYTVLPGGTP